MTDFEMLISNTTPNVHNAIEQIRTYIFDFYDNIEEKITENMICYRGNILVTKKNKTIEKNIGIFWINLTNKKKLRCHMRKLVIYNNDYNKIIDNGWGGYPEITFKECELNDDILLYLKKIINDAFKGVSMDDYIDDINNSESRIIIDKNIEEYQKRISYQPTNPTVQTLYENYKDGELILAPDFQRNYVWNRQKASNLIESLILNIPLPLIFTAMVENGTEEVVDGQQRLTSIFSFIDGSFPDGSQFKLSKNLKILYNEIGGKSYKDLDKNYQKQIKKYSLPVITISNESQEDIKFEMFERLNTNITPLKEQELRNCLYRGKYNDFLKEMAGYSDFKYILNSENLSKRYSDVELVLMFFAFYHKSPDHYNTNIKQMLNIEMRDHQHDNEEQLFELEKSFKKSCSLIKHVFDKTAFNIFSFNNSTGVGRFGNSFNYGLYQILMYWFIGYEKPQIIPYSDLIREELLNLFIHNDEFVDTLTGAGTNSLTKLKMKFDIWGNTLKGILQYPVNQARSFRYELKQQLFDKNQTCQICSQRIHSLDDAEVDHIDCYWRGGKTIPENARLTHRFCNRKKSGSVND